MIEHPPQEPCCILPTKCKTTTTEGKTFVTLWLTITLEVKGTSINQHDHISINGGPKPALFCCCGCVMSWGVDWPEDRALPPLSDPGELKREGTESQMFAKVLDLRNSWNTASLSSCPTSWKAIGTVCWTYHQTLRDSPIINRISYKEIMS